MNQELLHIDTITIKVAAVAVLISYYKFIFLYTTI